MISFSVTSWLARRSNRIQITLAVLISSVLAGVAVAALGPIILAVVGGGLAWAASVRFPVPLYALYLYLGVFKGESIVQQMPVDATAAIFVVLASVCVIRAFAGRAHNVPALLVAFILGLGAWMAVSLAWTPVQDYAYEKVFFFVTLSALAALAPFFFFDTQRDILVFVGVIIGLASLAGVVGIAFAREEAEAFEVGGSEGRHITGGRLLCAAGLILLAFPTIGSERWRPIAFVTGTCLIVTAAVLGSRGAIVALLVAGVALVLLRTLTEPRKAFGAVGALAIVATAIAVSPLPGTSLERTTDAVADPFGTVASDTRSSIYEAALDLLVANPLTGVGVGGFASVSFNLADTSATYPHNILLELGAELGVVAALAFILILARGLAKQYFVTVGAQSERGRQLGFLVIGILLYHFMAANLSSDLNGNRPLWGFLGLLWLTATSTILEPPTLHGGASSGSARPRPAASGGGSTWATTATQTPQR